MDVLIRTAAPTDLVAVGTLTVDVYGGEQLVSTGYLPVLADAAARADAPLTEVVVATRAPSSSGMSSGSGEPGERILGAPGAPGERILGALTLCRFGSPFADLAEEGEAEIRMLAVRFEARQRGVGEALVLDSAERARAHGCTRLVLSTMPVMESAQRLYERTGFRRIAHRDLTLRQGLGDHGRRLPRRRLPRGGRLLHGDPARCPAPCGTRRRYHGGGCRNGAGTGRRRVLPAWYRLRGALR